MMLEIILNFSFFLGFIAGAITIIAILFFGFLNFWLKKEYGSEADQWK
jgi:hypothetical protein